MQPYWYGIRAYGSWRYIVIPLGCYTLVPLRRSGVEEWRFAGDVYVDGYMDGRIIEEWKDGKRELAKYKSC